MSVYQGQVICLATLHGKEQALARPFALGLGASLRVSACDTNALGTFSGEVERPADALSTCLRKAELGMEATGLRLGLASEGSFGPHPHAGDLPAGGGPGAASALPLPPLRFPGMGSGQHRSGTALPRLRFPHRARRHGGVGVPQL